MEITITLSKDTNTVLLNNNTLDYELLYDLSLKVIDEGKTLKLTFENFEDIPDVEKYYREIFESINNLSKDPELNELRETLKKIEE